MPIDFRPTELDTRCREETTFHMSIRHRPSGILVAGSGNNRYATECNLLDKLREKLKQSEEDECQSKPKTKKSRSKKAK